MIVLFEKRPVMIYRYQKSERSALIKHQNVEEPDDRKRCAVVRTDRIANSVGWSSRQLTPRRTTYLNSKEKGDKSLFVKREVTDDVYGTVPQRLSDMAKAKLLES